MAGFFYMNEKLTLYLFNFQRAALLESLSLVQASPDEAKRMTAISTVQTIGLRKLNDYNFEKSVEETNDTSDKKFSSIAGNIVYIFLEIKWE